MSDRLMTQKNEIVRRLQSATTHEERGAYLDLLLLMGAKVEMIISVNASHLNNPDTDVGTIRVTHNVEVLDKGKERQKVVDTLSVYKLKRTNQVYEEVIA